MADYGRAAVLDKPNGTFSVHEYQVPDPAPGTFVLRTDLTGICATDAHMYLGQFPGMKYPIVLGHEISGTLHSLGSGVTEDTLGQPVKAGDNVVLVPGVPCRRCYYCTIAATANRCENVKAYGFANDDDVPLSGGYSQYIYAQFPGTSFMKTSLPAEISVLNEPVSIAVHGIERAGMRLGSIALVQGSGAIGLGSVVMAQKAGAYKVIVVGGPKRRLELAKRMGADVVIDIAEVPDPAERLRIIRDETPKGRGVDAVFECTGFPSSLPEGFEAIRDSGKFIELGHFTDTGSVSINPHHHLLKKNITIHAAWGGEVRYLAQALPYLEKREHPYEEWVSHRLGLDEVQEGVDTLNRRGWVLRGAEEVVKIAIEPWKA